MVLNSVRPILLSKFQFPLIPTIGLANEAHELAQQIKPNYRARRGRRQSRNAPALYGLLRLAMGFDQSKQNILRVALHVVPFFSLLSHVVMNQKIAQAQGTTRVNH